MAKFYVISKVSFEYNDEIYHTGEDETYQTPSQVYLDKKKAKEAAHLLELKEWKGLDLSSYCYNWNEIVSRSLGDDALAVELAKIFSSSRATRPSTYEKRKQSLDSIFASTLKGTALVKAVEAALEEEFPDGDNEVKLPQVDLDSWSVPEDATVGQIEQCMNLFTLRFFVVNEVLMSEDAFG